MTIKEALYHLLISQDFAIKFVQNELVCISNTTGEEFVFTEFTEGSDTKASMEMLEDVIWGLVQMKKAND